MQSYDTVNASLVSKRWAGRVEVPVPPEWVRSRLHLPRKYQYCCLHSDVSAEYGDAVFKTARGFVESFGDELYYGGGVVLAGVSGVGKTWTAAAIANEVMSAYGRTESGTDIQLSVEWLPVSWKLQRLFDYRHFRRQDEYYEFKNRIHRADLLVVDDLLHASDFSQVKEFLFGLYDYRDQHSKPTVTTVNVMSKETVWDDISAAFSVPFSRRLHDSAEGRTLVLS